MALRLAPQPVLLTGLCFWCAVSASELFTISEFSSKNFAIDPVTSGPLIAISRWLPPRIFGTLAGVVWVLAALRVEWRTKK